MEGCPNVVTLPNETRLFSFGEGIASRPTESFASGDERSGEYDSRQLYSEGGSTLRWLGRYRLSPRGFPIP